jgi:hypothetical protein
MSAAAIVSPPSTPTSFHSGHTALPIATTLPATAEQEISSAWHAYQQTEKRGLEFGRGAVCFGRMGGDIRKICGEEYANKTVCLMRGVVFRTLPKTLRLIQHILKHNRNIDPNGGLVFAPLADSRWGCQVS